MIENNEFECHTDLDLNDETKSLDLVTYVTLDNNQVFSKRTKFKSVLADLIENQKIFEHRSNNAIKNMLALMKADIEEKINQLK